MTTILQQRRRIDETLQAEHRNIAAARPTQSIQYLQCQWIHIITSSLPDSLVEKNPKVEEDNTLNYAVTTFLRTESVDSL
ncbi:hypothetical protein PAMP_013247 [Pampus punctatissimus]